MTSISDLQPAERLRVYDLVHEAGIDVSDWSNYKRRDSPATNPKYCYEWAFSSPDKVVVCLWFGEMQKDEKGIFQNLDYRERPIQRPELSAIHKQRCWKMDRTFRKAFAQKLPVRVIIVDGPVDAFGDSSVQNRSLDTEFWHVVAYDEESGSCRIQRGLEPAHGAQLASSDTMDDLGFDPELIGRDAAERIQKTVSGVKRDPAVRRAVIKRCNGACERPGCGEERGYDGFLDVHHILGVETSDRLRTCVALCPNCHREAHFFS